MPARRPAGPRRARRRLSLPPRRSVLLVALGGGAGTLARVAASAAAATPDDRWPWATLLLNVSGAVVLAVLLTLVTERVTARPWVRPLVGTGLLGSYTTFSTLSLETQRLLAAGRAALAVAYVAVSVTAGLSASVVGIIVVRAARRRSDVAR